MDGRQYDMDLNDRPHRVLVVDPLEETREVLRTAFESRGIEFQAASEPDDGLQLARDHRPDVIVLDVENGGEDEIPAGFEQQALEHSSALVLLGTFRHRHPPSGEFVLKPYHYGALIRKIEELLCRPVVETLER